MEYRHLGRSGLKVSPLCLGTMNFGPFTSEEDSHAIMDRALEAGINFFDTANVYGRTLGPGTTESIIGRWLAQGGGRREKIVLATKVNGRMSDWPNDSLLSARNIIKACDGSLKRLQTDYIDLYQMHHIDRGTPWEEIWQAMEQLVRTGKVIYVGSSNFPAWELARGQEMAKNRHFMGLVSEQSLYNLRSRMIELEVIPACKAYGLAMIPWSPLSGGLLGGTPKTSDKGRRAGMQGLSETLRKQLEQYENLCDEIGESPANVALSWLLHQDAVTALIIGPRTLTQLNEALKVPEIQLSPETMDKLDQLFPGPGGQAPEAYAW